MAQATTCDYSPGPSPSSRRGPFAYYYALVGSDLWIMFEFHTVRGVQIESSYATVMMLAIPADQLRCYYGYGSWNLGGAWEADLLTISSWLLPAVLLLFGFQLLRPGPARDFRP